MRLWNWLINFRDFNSRPPINLAWNVTLVWPWKLWPPADPCMFHHLTPPSLFCAPDLLTPRPGGFPTCSPRPAVEGGEQDGEDGGVGAVRYARGRRVRRGSDSHGLGTRLDTSAVLMRPMGTGQEPLIKPRSFCNTSKRLTLTTWRSNLLLKEVFWCQKGYFHFSAKNPKHFGHFVWDETWNKNINWKKWH